MNTNATVINLERISRYDRVDVPALDLELTIVDVLGSFFGRPGLVGVDSGDQDQRYLIAERDGDGLRVERWTGATYREELHARALEATDGPADAVVPIEDSTRVRDSQRVHAGA
ncbi:hypothetical protein [Natronorubrum sp. DTA7]|uniref:hypothetical protein n=1 Tax=Natronorubrum sp. DTA7 TaxID=3447016 RepID=UPI003F857766